MKRKFLEVTPANTKQKIILKERPELRIDVRPLPTTPDGSIDIDSSEVKNNNLYKQIQQAQEIDASSDYGLYAIAQMAGASKSVHTVNFSHNSLGEDEESVKVAEALAKSPSITHVDFSYNHLGNKLHLGVPKVAVKIAEALVKSTSITHIDFSYNHSPYPHTYFSVAEALVKSSVLRYVNFSGNVKKEDADLVASVFIKHNNSVFISHEEHMVNIEEQLYLLNRDDFPFPTSLIELVGEYVGHHIEFDI